jgi:nucleoside phosphorylase
MSTDLLLVAATDIELCGHDGLVCGIGPVEAAVATAEQLARERPGAVLHVGVAGGRRLTPGALVLGTESAYIDLAAEIPVVDRVGPDAGLLETLRAEFPDAVALPIATSASVTSGPVEHEFLVEAMEGFGVLRACALAGVPAVEVRAISNDLGEGDRARWMIQRGLEVLHEAMPRLLGALSK